MTSKNKPKRKQVYMVRIDACRNCYVEAASMEQAAEIAEAETRFGDLLAEGHVVTRLNKKQTKAAYDLGRVLKG